MEYPLREALELLQSFLEKNQDNLEVTVLGGDAPLPDNVTFRTQNLKLNTKNLEALSTEGILILKGDGAGVTIHLHSPKLLVRENLPYWSRGIMIGNEEEGLVVLIRPITGDKH